MFGLQIKTLIDERYNRPRDLIGEVTTAPAGNLVLRIGRECGDGEYGDAVGWAQIAHVVLTPGEAREFVAKIESELAARSL